MINLANYVTKIWKHADQPVVTSSSPVGNGWVLQDGAYAIKWYDGDQVPNNLSQLLEDNIQNTDDADDDTLEYNPENDEPGSDDEYDNVHYL